MLSMMLAATPSVLVLSPSLVQHAYPYSQLMPSFHPSLSYNPWSSPLAHRNPFGYATQVAMPRHSVLELLDDMMKLSRRNVFDDEMKKTHGVLDMVKMVERVPTWKDDEEGGTVSTALDVRGVPAESLSSELDADGTTLTIRGATPTLRLEHSVALPAAADADKIALELTEDGRLLVRVENPAAPPEPTQIPIAKRVVAEEKRVEPPAKDAAALETELDSKFAVAPSPEATASAEVAVADADAEKAEVEAAA